MLWRIVVIVIAAVLGSIAYDQWGSEVAYIVRSITRMVL